MIEATFYSNKERIAVKGLYQYDQGQQLKISGLDLTGNTVEVHYAHENTGFSAVVCETTISSDGSVTVGIPDALLATSGNLIAWVHILDSSSAKTIKRIDLHVQGRAKPGDYSSPEDFEQNKPYIIQAVQEVAETKNYVDGLIGQISSLSTKEQSAITALSTTEQSKIMATAASALAEANKEAIKIGGRNYIPNSSLTENLTGFASNGLAADVAVSEYTRLSKSATTTARQSITTTEPAKLDDEIYTLSGWIYVEETNGALAGSSFFVRTFKADGSMVSDFINIVLTDTNCPTGQWIKVSGTGTPGSGSNLAYGGMTNLALASGFIGKVRIKKWKLEKGSVPTDWTPEPEDMATQVQLNKKKDNEYGLFVDNRTQPTTGYWHKVLTCKISAYQYTDINMRLSVMALFCSAIKPCGDLLLSVRQNADGATTSDISLCWTSANIDMSNWLKQFAINVVADSTGNYIELYIHNTTIYTGYKVTVIDKGTRLYELTFAAELNNPATTTLTELPTNGTIIYSTLGHCLQSIVDIKQAIIALGGTI